MFDKRKKIYLLDTDNVWSYAVICKKCGLIDNLAINYFLWGYNHKPGDGERAFNKIVNDHVCENFNRYVTKEESLDLGQNYLYKCSKRIIP